VFADGVEMEMEEWKSPVMIKSWDGRREKLDGGQREFLLLRSKGRRARRNERNEQARSARGWERGDGTAAGQTDRLVPGEEMPEQKGCARYAGCRANNGILDS
jgi:hypothetical protein